MHWDLFCRVVDNFGDIGVCWRLARELAARGERVRLWIDDASALAWMAPEGTGAVEIVRWSLGPPDHAPGDVVVETFGCDPPPRFVCRMAERRGVESFDGSDLIGQKAPVWIDLEYLSAEDYVGRSHGLPSPQQAGPGAGLTKWFYFPGFDASTGGLMRERHLLERRRSFDAGAWLTARGIEVIEAERIVSLFCYANARLPALLDALSERPTLLLTTPGAATQQVLQALDSGAGRNTLRVVGLPFLAQDDFDRLLWTCDLNFVRGEDSFVRAQWAGRPFVWQAYPQHDAAHDVKLTAFLDRLLKGATPQLSSAVRAIHVGWNSDDGSFELPPLLPWRRHCEAWCEHLASQPELVDGLIGFARQNQ